MLLAIQVELVSSPPDRKKICRWDLVSQVTLQGGLRDVERAFERMWTIVQRKEAEDAEEDPYIALTPDRLALQFQTVKLVIPAARAGGIIGKKGEGIKQLRRETGAVVNVQSSRDLLQPVRCEGWFSTARWPSKRTVNVIFFPCVCGRHRTE